MMYSIEYLEFVSEFSCIFQNDEQPKNSRVVSSFEA